MSARLDRVLIAVVLIAVVLLCAAGYFMWRDARWDDAYGLDSNGRGRFDASVWLRQPAARSAMAPSLAAQRPGAVGALLGPPDLVRGDTLIWRGNVDDFLFERRWEIRIDDYGTAQASVSGEGESSSDRIIEIGGASLLVVIAGSIVLVVRALRRRRTVLTSAST